jgi:hypothetical protein
MPRCARMALIGADLSIATNGIVESAQLTYRTWHPATISDEADQNRDEADLQLFVQLPMYAARYTAFQ